MEVLLYPVYAAIIFILLIALALHVVSAIAYMRVLTMLGYPRPWAVWIPLYRLYALADVVRDSDGTTELFGQHIRSDLYNFWWVLMVVVRIPVIGGLAGNAVCVIFLGNCFAKIYSKMEKKPESETKVLGFFSGWLPIIAVVKFFMY